MRLIIPDVLLLIASIICLIICNKVHKKNIEIKRGNFYNTKDQNQEISDATIADKQKFEKLNKFLPSKSTFTTFTTVVTQLDGEEITRPETLTNLKIDSSQHSPIDQTPPKKQKLSELSRFLNSKIIPVLRQLIFMLLLFTCGTFRPSALSIPYFVAFLSLVVRLLFSKTIRDNRFQVTIKVLLLFYSTLHMLLIYVYQLKLFQYVLPSNELPARLLDLMNVFYTDCNQPAHFYLNPNVVWQQCVYPFILFLLYWFTAVEFSYVGFNASLSKKSSKSNNPATINVRQMYDQVLKK
jgi:hypothetical protein